MRSVIGIVWIVAAVLYYDCGDGSDRNPPDVAEDSADPGGSQPANDIGSERGGDDARDQHSVPVGRDLIVDTSLDSESREGVHDVPRDLPREVQDVVRELPYVHRDTGGEFPTRDTGAVP